MEPEYKPRQFSSGYILLHFFFIRGRSKCGVTNLVLTWLSQIVFQCFSEEGSISKAWCWGRQVSGIFSPGCLSQECWQGLGKEAVSRSVVQGASAQTQRTYSSLLWLTLKSISPILAWVAMEIRWESHSWDCNRNLIIHVRYAISSDVRIFLPSPSGLANCVHNRLDFSLVIATHT